jgi:hypothetical protein
MNKKSCFITSLPRAGADVPHVTLPRTEMNSSGVTTGIKRLMLIV